jgi:DNA-binding transcriptional ArsR family regulator
MLISPETGTVAKNRVGAEGCADVLRALGDATRLAVLQALLEGPLHVNDLQKRVTVGQSLLSHHLKVLRDAGLVHAERDGKAVLYRVAPEIAEQTPGQCLDLKCCQVVFSPVAVPKSRAKR